MTQTYRLTLQADSDLEGIFLYTAKKWGISQAEIYLKKLDSHMQKLSQNKIQGKSCDLMIWRCNSKTANLLYSKSQSHYIIFRNIDAGIEVLALYHANMDLDQHIKKLAR